MHRDPEPITPMTVRPLRVLGAIAAGAVLIAVSTVLLVEGIDRYQLWRADGVWCARADSQTVRSRNPMAQRPAGIDDQAQLLRSHLGERILLCL